MKVLSLVGWKHHTPQPLLILIIKNILWFLPKTYLISFPAFGVLHLALQRGGCPARWVFRKPGPDSNFAKHFPYFRCSFSPWFNHRVTSVSFLHFPHKEILSSKAPSKRPALLSCSAYLTEEWRQSSGTWQMILILPSCRVLVMNPSFFPQRHHARATGPHAAQNPAHSRCSDECPPSQLCF